jgi:hypothetical protein
VVVCFCRVVNLEDTRHEAENARWYY